MSRIKRIYGLRQGLETEFVRQRVYSLRETFRSGAELNSLYANLAETPIQRIAIMLGKCTYTSWSRLKADHLYLNGLIHVVPSPELMANACLLWT